MRRYWLDQKLPDDGLIEIRGDVFHHIFDVCRRKSGDHFELLGQGGQALLVEAVTVNKTSATVTVIEKRLLPPLPKPHVHLALAIPRFHVMEAVLEKAVELGTYQLHPFFSDYSFVRSHDKITANRMERWHKIVVSATQQSGRGDLMQVRPPLELRQLIEEFSRSATNQGLLAYEGEAPASLSEVLKTIELAGEDVWIFVGSEGGFSQREVTDLQAVGIKAATLGSQVLRVETACIALLSILKYELGQLAARKK